jgi:hypothetical protein
MELFVVFEEPQIRSDLMLSYVTLGVWTLSLFQFCLTLTATRDVSSKIFARETSFNDDVEEEIPKDKEKEQMPSCCDKVFELEIWSLFIAILLQDGPFLGVRLYAMINKGVLSYGIIFFTAKNMLMILMQMYRLVVICMKINKVEDVDKGGTPLNNTSKVPPEKKMSKTSMATRLGSTLTKSSFLNEK